MNCKYCLFVLILISVLSFLSLLPISAQDVYNGNKPFKRHFIICVDQTISSSNPNLAIIYNSLCDWFSGDNSEKDLNLSQSTIPVSVAFDPDNDVMSLFAFAMTGSGMNMGYDYGRIHQLCANCHSARDCEKACDEITKALIHPRKRYYHGQSFEDYDGLPMEFGQFMQNELKPLFFGGDQLYQTIKNGASAITMSHFVYPLILDFIPKDETANEYYIILVSDFKSGQYSNNDTEDWKIFNNLCPNNQTLKRKFEEKLKNMSAPFVQSDFMHLQTDGYNSVDAIGARCTQLLLKNVANKSRIFMSSSLTLAQKEGSVFDLSPARISYDKGELAINSIQIVLSDASGEIRRETLYNGDDDIAALYDPMHHEYVIPRKEYDLRSSEPRDIMVDYVFYTMSRDEAGNEVLPIAVMASQTIGKDTIKTIDQEFRRNMTIFIIAAVLLLIFIFLIINGRKKTVAASLSRFAQKYVNVTPEKGAVELPCWFYVKDRNTATVHISGKVSCKNMLSIGGSRKLYVRLQETKPEGFSYYINRDRCKEYTMITTKGGQFEINLDIAINPEVVDIHKLHTCSVMIDFMVKTTQLGFIKHTDYELCPMVYDFYFIEELGRTWVGFDPGTSGSCVAIGNPSGALNNPNIAMVEERDGVNSKVIIPSRLVFDTDVAGKSVDQLRPGIDYKYGLVANRNWTRAINEGKPRFQSIKKLLGYKKGSDDKIKLSTGRSTMELTGVDMAHLLVKGLNKDLDDYLATLSPAERQRVADNDANPRRAVVAIPNNYTLPKILDMVDSIRRLNRFREVRFIFEAEGVLFNYLRKTFGEKHPKSETVMIYDMGGATINISIFRIEYENRDGSIYYNISTLGRIGYAVGGDNIDVALMERTFELKEWRDNSRHRFQQQYKSTMLHLVLGLKLNIINTMAGNTSVSDIGVLADPEGFNSFASNITQRSEPTIDTYANVPTDKYAKKMAGDYIASKELSKFVYEKVKDAVSEILNYPGISRLSKIDKLIFSGRSTTFPGIRDAVKEASKSKSPKIWNFSEDELKTAVAYGACWYGIYNGLVTLDNSRLSSAYGYKLTTGVDSKLKVLLGQNMVFDEDNKAKCVDPVESLFDGDGQTVSFFQIMGSGVGKELLSKENRHKVNFLTSIPVLSKTQSVGIEVSRNNSVSCQVTFDTGETTVRNDASIETRDITEENDWAYIFAVEDKEDTTARSSLKSGYKAETSSVSSSSSGATVSSQVSTSNKKRL